MSLRGRVGLSALGRRRQSIYIGRSAIHGEGMIAGRRFEAGETVWRLTGKPVFGAVTESGPNYIGLGPDVWIDPDLPLDHINHHCAPNAAFGPRRQLLALRPIEAHEEVTIDYSTTEADPAWSMRCGCGAADCRGMLYAIQHSFAHAPTPPRGEPADAARLAPPPRRRGRRAALPAASGRAAALRSRLRLQPPAAAAAATAARRRLLRERGPRLAVACRAASWPRGQAKPRVYASLTGIGLEGRGMTQHLLRRAALAAFAFAASPPRPRSPRMTGAEARRRRRRPSTSR